VKIVDRSLREETTGVYTTTARLPKHGTYNVSLLLDSPGVYEATVNVPEAGVYLVFVESPSLRVRYRQLPYLTLTRATKRHKKQKGIGEPVWPFVPS